MKTPPGDDSAFRPNAPALSTTGDGLLVEFASAHAPRFPARFAADSSLGRFELLDPLSKGTAVRRVVFCARLHRLPKPPSQPRLNCERPDGKAVCCSRRCAR